MMTRLTIIFITILLGLFVVHLDSGVLDIGILDVLASFSQADAQDKLVLLEIRFPRSMLLVLIGFGLGISGAAIQSHVRNPLAEPSLLGISSTAAVLSVLVFYFGFSVSYPWLQPVMGITGALISASILVYVSSRGYSIASLILAGVAINAFTGAMISLLINFAPNPFAVGEIVFWLLGSVTNRSLGDAILVLPFTVLGSVMILATRNWLNVLSLGSEVAVSMGHNRMRNELLIIVGIAFCVGAGVSVAGIIGFVGLLVPHIARPLVNNMPGNSLVLSGLLGACFLLFADLVVLNMPGANELKLGVVTAFIGAPFFFYVALTSQEY